MSKQNKILTHCELLTVIFYPLLPHELTRWERRVGEIKLCTKRIAMRLLSQGDLRVVHLQPCSSEHKAERPGRPVWYLFGASVLWGSIKVFHLYSILWCWTFLMICTLLFLHLSWWFVYFIFFVRVFSLFSFKNQSMLCRYRQLCWLSTLFPAFHSGDLHVDCCLRKSFWHYLFFLLKFIIYEKHFVF